jgi:hypothetical protein
MRLNWLLEKICTIEIPNHGKSYRNDYYWKMIFDGVQIPHQ